MLITQWEKINDIPKEISYWGITEVVYSDSLIVAETRRKTDYLLQQIEQSWSRPTIYNNPNGFIHQKYQRCGSIGFLR